MSARRGKARSGVWRDAVRDSDLDRTAKAVAFVLSTYLNGSGLAWPSQETLAAGASVSDRAVQLAIVRLEAAGFVEVDRSRSRAGNRYVATLPVTANALRRSEWSNGERDARNGERDARNGERRSPESSESVESVALRAAASPSAAAASAGCEECGVGGGRHEEGCPRAGAA